MDTGIQEAVLSSLPFFLTLFWLYYSVPFPSEGTNYKNGEWKKKKYIGEEYFKGKGELLHSLVLGMSHGAYYINGCCTNTLTMLISGNLSSTELEGCFLVSTCVLYWDCHLLPLFLHLWALVGWDRIAKQVASAEEFLEQHKKKPCLCGSSDRYLKEKKWQIFWVSQHICVKSCWTNWAHRNEQSYSVVLNHEG